MNIMPHRFEKKVEFFVKRFKAQCYLDYSSDYRDSIFLSGVPRSGTTWLSDVLNYKGQYRYIFEPYHPKEVHLCKNLNPRKYIRENSQDLEFFKIANKILSGNIRSYWSNRFNTKIISNKRLIKTVRANLHLKWIYNTFPGLPIIFLIRHPMASTVSKVKLGWKRSLSGYLNQPMLIEDFLYPFHDEMKCAEERYLASGDSFENHLFSWCIENYVPLKQFKVNDIHIVFYENCCVNPEDEVDRLFGYLKEDYDNGVLDSINSASKLSRKDSPIMTGNNLISSWKKYVADEQMLRGIEILRLFQLDKLYSHESMPFSKNIDLIMNDSNSNSKNGKNVSNNLPENP
ncbi:MAG: sulfotransferase [Leptolyngbya sp. SIO1D8]|nr:sulfotransferase [Leptolyngbya sp. SIO1D8]